MKKTIILLISLFFINLTFSQKRVIKITNLNSNREIIIKENRRIKIKIFDGEKISGKFKILDNENILIKNRQIEIKDIQKIKRNPLLISIGTDVFIIYNGVALLGASLVISAVTSESSALLLMIPALGIIYGGIKSPNFLKGYNKNRDWKYEIKIISE